MSQTKKDIIVAFGTPTKIAKNSDAFFAHSYEEDCFLMGGGRRAFEERLEWQNGNSFRVVYLRDGKVWMFFLTE